MVGVSVGVNGRSDVEGGVSWGCGGAKGHREFAGPEISMVESAEAGRNLARGVHS
jgi:hypothetical protein